MQGPYRPLYEFLRSRFADRVVLTFGQVEDLLGFRLPVAASHDREWWLHPDAGADEPGRSWDLALRSATPNLGAKTVAFERVSER
ncbi:MAG TPA: hypothetical protein VMM93_06145 [Vicinamibacterales bacterium]|nr:hypothetical protein [Vicinamibacterales bacterium]